MTATDPQPAAETPDFYGAYPRLGEAEIDSLVELGERRATETGQILFRDGDQGYDFFVVLAGKVAVVEAFAGKERVIGIHGPGRFLGELTLLTGQPAFLTAVVREAGEVLAVPVERLRELLSRDASLGDLILRALMIRRSILIGIGTGFRIVGSRYSSDTRRLHQFAARNRLPHSWIDLEQDKGAEALLREVGVAPEETPVVILRSEQVLRNPSNAELAQVLGLRTASEPDSVSDLVVVGAGPAGLAAAVYGASEGLDTVAVDAVATGGQAGTTSQIENYLGFPAGISGSELADRAVVQAEKFGARISVPAEASGLAQSDGHYVVGLEDGNEISARSVVIATGSRYRRLDIPRLADFEGVSVHYAATQVEAMMCAGDPVAVVGGGNSAGQAAVFLSSRQIPKVRLLILHEDLGRDMSRYLADRIERNPNIEVMRCTKLEGLVGDKVLEGLVVQNNKTGESQQIDARALFIFVGQVPHAGWLEGQLALDGGGFILTGKDAARSANDGAWQDLRRDPLMLETSLPGVFAAGDVRSGSIKRMASAVGEGSMAVRLVHEHLADHQHVDLSAQL